MAESPFDAPVRRGAGRLRLRPPAGALDPRRLAAAGPKTIRARIYLTLTLTILLTLGATGLALFFVLGGLQDDLAESRVREIATAWGPAVFSEEGESRTLETLLAEFETSERLTGSISDDADISVLGLDSEGRVVRVFEQGDRFLGERLGISAPDGAGLAEGSVEAPGGERLAYAAARLSEAAGERQGFCCVAVALAVEPRSALLDDLAFRLVVAGLSVALIASVFGFVLSRSIYRPVQRVAAAARSMARGMSAQRVEIGGSQEARELGESFNNMAEEVERQQRALRDFLANVSHDLQTPLTSINGFSRALMDRIMTGEDERANAYRIIEDESRRLLRLVEGLVDLSRIEAGAVEVELKRVDLRALAAHVAALFELRAADLDVRLEHLDEQVPEVLGDWDRLDQVLGNLVDNALRHTPPGGQVLLSMRRESETSVGIGVADTGVGIAEEALPHLFDRYFRSDRPGAQGGTGLGLAIARELVRAQGGEIQVSSRPGVGTTFRVILRAAPDEEAEPERAGRPEPTAAG